MAIIKSENWDGVTAPAIPSGWTVDSAPVTATTNSPTSAPNSLVHPAASANAANVPHATWATQDTNAGNVQVSATVRHANTGAGAGEQDVWVFARASAVLANSNFGSSSCYTAGIHRNGSSPGLVLSKQVSGTGTTLGNVGAAAFADATNYRIALNCQGSTIQATCQRLSDNFWLDASGSFVSDPSNATVAISVTDTALAASAGYNGVAFYLANTSGGDLGVDDWLLETAVAASIRATPARLQAGSGPVSVTLVGTNTNFSTSSSTQFTLSGGTGASIVSQSASSAGAATLSLNPGTASGPLTITDTTDGSITTTIAVQATYYVSPAGSDSNTGLDTAHAWQTIAHVNAQTLHSGDQVLLQGGQTHSGTLVIQNSGTQGSPILLSSYGTGPATITPGTGTGIQVKDADYVRVSTLIVAGPGITLSGSTSSSTSTGSGIEVLSTHTQAAITSWRQSVYLADLVVSGSALGISCHSNAGSAAGPYPVGYNDLRITGCTVHDCLQNGIRVAATTSDPLVGIENGPSNAPYHKNVYIGGCSVYTIPGDSAFSAGATGNGILVSNVDGGITERCVVHDCGQADGHTGGGGAVANWCYAAQRYVIQYCESHHMHDATGQDGAGFDLDGGAQSCVIQYCYSHDNDGSGYLVGSYGGPAPTQNNVLRYNVSQNDGRTIQSAAYRIFNAPTGTTVYNNTFYSGTPGTTPTLLGPITEGSFYNNIFWCGSGVSLFTAVSGGTFAGNLYWFGGGSFSAVYSAVTYSSLAAFQAVQETAAGVPSGLFADPLLAAAGGGSALLPASPVAALAAYQLGSSSPAIDAGLDLRTLFALDTGLIDFNGLPNRAGMTYDIGACEHGAAALIAASAGLRRVNLAGGIGG